jgi:hypothetical protein
MAYLASPQGLALRQGDILGNVKAFSIKGFNNHGEPFGDLVTHRYTIVVTQDCDLEQDHGARFPKDGEDVFPDKLLFGVLLCGVYNEDDVKAGIHRPQAMKFGRREWKPVEHNKEPRYQYLGSVPSTNCKLVADFKDFMMVPCTFLYDELHAGNVQRVAEMNTPYKEHLLQRFAGYLMRVGLPIDFHRLSAAPPHDRPDDDR